MKRIQQRHRSAIYEKSASGRSENTFVFTLNAIDETDGGRRSLSPSASSWIYCICMKYIGHIKRVGLSVLTRNS